MSQPPYEIRLVVESDPAAASDAPSYLVHWQNMRGLRVTRPVSLTPPLTLNDLKDLRWYLEEFVRFPGVGDRRRAELIVPKLRAWGEALFAVAFGAPDAQQIYAHMQQAEARGRLCQITIGCDIPLVLQQPWELLHDGQGWLTFRGITVRRQLPESKDTQLPLLAAPLRVLLIVSRPEDIGFIDPRTSIKPLLEAVSALPPGQVQVDFCEPPTFARLEEIVSQARRQNWPFHIVHFDGHGTYLPQTGVGALAFENDRAECDLVSGRRLGDLLSRLNVPLVILEACRSADLSAHPPQESVAPALLEAGVGSVVAFSHSVHVEAAQLLVERFYQRLAEGVTVGRALDESRTKLHASSKRWVTPGPHGETIELADWFIPQLYQVGADPTLLTAVAAPASTNPPLVPLDATKLHGFPPSPRYDFQGRAQDLLRLERDFRQVPAVLLTAMGGMGKTALAREAAVWWLQTGRIEAAVFVSLENRPTPERIVQQIGQALDGEAFTARNEAEQRAWVVAAFRARKLLVVWDNVESVLLQFQAGLESELLRYSEDDLVRLRRLFADLTANKPLGRLLLTCRPAALDWANLKVRELTGLARPDSQYVLRAVLERHTSNRVPEHDREEIDRLLDLLDDHPLSIELVGPHLLKRTPQAIRAEFQALLMTFISDAPEEARNRSLKASLAFSTRHLSDGARALLPWLAWFSRGVLENQLRGFTDMTAEVLAPLRAELVGTALVRLEEIEGFTSPFWRLHPTLPYATRPEDVPDPQAAEARFIAVYQNVMREANQTLRGPNPAFGMALMQLEEPNYRAALALAFRRGERQAVAYVADTIQVYLQMAGRQRERDGLVQWVRERVAGDGRLDDVIVSNIINHAWTLVTEGNSVQAIAVLQELLTRLTRKGEIDEEPPVRQQALTLQYLGRVYVERGRADLALGPLQQAVVQFEQLGEVEQLNLAVALGDLANVHIRLGQLAAALALAEQGLAIHRRMRNALEIAMGLNRIAQVLMMQQRYREADARYEEALAAARHASNRELEGTTLQHWGLLQNNLGNHDQAVRHYQEALRLFQQAGDQGSEMRTSDLLGTAESERGNLEAAQAWYERARELAVFLNDQQHLGVVAQNLGILHKRHAQRVIDAAQRTGLLRQAVASVRESLDVWQAQHNQINAAASFFQLGNLFLLLGDLTQAEEHLTASMQIHETLESPDVSKDYANLALVAHARGEKLVAVRWWVRYETKEAELVQRRSTGGQMPPLVRFEPLLRGIAAVTRGEATQRAKIEALLPQLEQNGWRIAEASRRMWAGERDLATLTVGLDVQDIALIARILQFIADPAVAPLLPEEVQEPAASIPEDLLAALPVGIRAAIQQGDQAALQRAFEALSPQGQYAVAEALQAAQSLGQEADQATPFLQQLDPLLQAVAAIARGDESQRLEVDEALAQLEGQGVMLRGAAQRIWQGERDEATLMHGLDNVDSTLARRILDILGR